MKLRFTHLKLTLVFLLFSSALMAQNNYRSSGGGSGNWHDPLSWQEETTPGNWVAAVAAPDNGDGVITIQNTHTITVAAGFPITADQVVVASGGTLVVNDVLTLNDGTGVDLQVNNGTLTQTSTITGAGTVQIDGTYNWNGGTLASVTTIGAIGAVFIQTSDKNLNAALTNNGSITWSASTITFNAGSITNNGTFTATGNNALAFGSGANSFSNTVSGSFSKNSGGTTSVNIPFSNAGTLGINAGIFTSGTANGSFTNSGTINFTAGTTLNVSGTAATNAFNAGSTLTETGVGTATMTITQNTNINTALNLVADITFNLNAPAATLGGTGPLTLNGIASWTNGALDVPTTVSSTGTLTINTPGNLTGPLTNNGTINWTGNNINFVDGSITNNAAMNATGNNSLTNGAGTNSFTNSASGTFTKSVGAGVTEILVTTSNAGNLTINSGSIGIRSTTFTNTGALNFSNTVFTTGSNATATSNFNAGTTITGTGTLENRNGSTTNINVPLTIANAVMTTGTVTGSGSLTLTNSWDWQATTLSVPTTINAGATATLAGGGARTLTTTLVNNGTINWTAQTISFSNATLTNNGAFNEASSGGGLLMANGGGTNSFSNSGTLNKTTAVAWTINLGVPVTNTGTIFGIGTYNFNGGITNSGVIRPGPPNAIGILAMTPNAVTANNTVIRVEIVSGAGAGTGHDRLDLSGNTTLSNATLIAVEPIGDVAPQQAYTIMTTTSGTFTGTFANVVIPGGWSITYNPTSVVLTKLTSTLPVSWGNFSALAGNNQVKLSWTTLQETNTSHFVVEHSSDGLHYNAIGTVTAAGNSNEESSYSFTHASPDKNKLNYYRLLQVDIDGKKEYSAIRTVRFDKGTPVSVLATPNPVRDRLQLSVQADDITVVLTDFKGNTLRVLRLKPGVHQVNMQEFAAGVYHLNIYQKQARVDSQKIFKL